MNDSCEKGTIHPETNSPNNGGDIACFQRHMGGTHNSLCLCYDEMRAKARQIKERVSKTKWRWFDCRRSLLAYVEGKSFVIAFYAAE